ncbi:MAG: primosomal protein N' [Phycisphaeraceae bacterium]|nr:primosomal protein N' [Phycisphaeraceae bacterium]
MAGLFDNSPAPDTGPKALGALPGDGCGFALVALEQGVDIGPDGLTYAVPGHLSDLGVGDRVVVPLGKNNKAVSGYILQVTTQQPAQTQKPHAIKAIQGRDPMGLSLTKDLIELARWLASYYCCPLGMVLVTMLPAAVKHGTGTTLQTFVRFPPGSDPGSSQAGPAFPCGATAGSSTPGSDGSDAASARDQGGSRKPPRISALQKRALEVACQRAEQARAGQDGGGDEGGSEGGIEGEHEGGWIELRALADLAGAKTTAPLRRLIEMGLLESSIRPTVRAVDPMLSFISAPKAGGDVGGGAAAGVGLELSEHQRAALDRIADSIHKGFSVHLLHGVTGSGKTEVYLRVIEHLLNGNGDGDLRSPAKRSDISGGTSGGGALPGAIVLVPEIALTPQTVARFYGRFGATVAVLHSGLSAAQRHEQWRRIRTGQARIVVGARSAIFAPLANLAVIIVDEEHDGSYKQDQLPRYHARDVAVRRAQLLDIPVVLGSATPSLESYYNTTAESGRGYVLHRLPERVTGLKLPRVEIVDLKEERKLRRGVHLLSMRLEGALRQTMANGGQAILLLNRRGYANYIACPDHGCGWMLNCAYCDALMIYHKFSAGQKSSYGGLVRCHHCGAEQLLPRVCPVCGKKVVVFGLGTQRVEEEMGKKFPGVTLLRMDSDTMSTSGDYQAALKAFGRGELQVLLGTQMIAKGLDFPNVQLVGVISADTALNMPDFRASERTFQLVAQVAGRAGRGGKGGHPGLVVVQSFSPRELAITLAAKHDFDEFARGELALRKQVNLPPITRLARIVVRDRDLEACLAHGRKLAEALAAMEKQMQTGARVQGPMPCPIARINQFHRQEIQVLAPDASRLQKLLTGLRNARVLKSDAHTAVDVDPVTLM